MPFPTPTSGGGLHVRLAAVRRLADEAADTGLLSPDLAAGIRQRKGSAKGGHEAWEACLL
jgi:hypothetical protein